MRSRKKHIAFIYEGEKTEKVLIEKMSEVYFANMAGALILSFPAAGNIYMIWNRLMEDGFETDVIEVVKEMSAEAKEKLGELSAEDFSEVYLFFDYDAHNDNLPKVYKQADVMQELLRTFDNETEYGKLYISYPMIESLRELSSKTVDYTTFYVPVNNEINYKEYVSSQMEFQNFKFIDEQKWEVACKASVKRANLIVNYVESYPTYDEFMKELGQFSIYQAQLEHFVKIGKMVGVLNSIPLFLLEYFEVDYWNKVIL